MHCPKLISSILQLHVKYVNTITIRSKISYCIFFLLFYNSSNYSLLIINLIPQFVWWTIETLLSAFSSSFVKPIQSK